MHIETRDGMKEDASQSLLLLCFYLLSPSPSSPLSFSPFFALDILNSTHSHAHMHACTSLHTKFIGSWRDASLVKSTYYSCR